ncbi:MAG TPA: hypothetical protein VFW73_06310 [Lacipirellulaceae bacterium]|nr:hypothetical protein [Lacipirellulaceae bacterium]
MKAIFFIVFIAAIVMGHIFAFVDSRPHFDDAGVLAFSIAIVCAILAFIYPRRPWLWALAVGIWVPIHSLIHNGSAGSFISLAFALAGAYVGALSRKSLGGANQSTS